MEGIVLLADYAQVHGGKLNVVGAGINLVAAHTAEPPHHVNLHAAVLITVPWQAHNQAHNLRVSLLNEDGEKVRIADAAPGTSVDPNDEGSVIGQFNAGRAPIMQPGESSLIPLAVPIQVAVPSIGSYRVVLEVDGTELGSAGFRVLYAPQLTAAG